MFDPSVTRTSLRDRGWTVDELNDPAMVVPYGAFASLAAVRERATRDLPAGTAVNWVSKGGITVGGFVVGVDAVGPPVADRFPAFVLWPDATEDVAGSVAELSALLRGRLDWLDQLATDAGFDAAEITSGHEDAERALDTLDHAGTLTPACCGPRYHASCAARVQPAALVRWDGFRTGWERPDGPPAEEQRHPVHPEHAGMFLSCWQDGVRQGVEARQQRAH